MYRLALAALGAGLLCGQSSQSPQELLKEAVTFHQQGKLEDAIRDYDLFLDLYPDAAEVRSNLGAALVATGRYARAIDEYKLALLKNSTPKLHLNLALAYYKTEDFRDAIAELEIVHGVDKDNAQATLLLADSYVRMGENKKAIDLLTPLYDAGQQDQGLVYVFGTALARDGQADRAQTVINPLLSGPDTAEKHMLMGTTKFGARDYTNALTELKQAEEMNPELPEVNSYYAQALFASGETEASRKIFEKELARNPNDFQSNVHLGLMLHATESYAAWGGRVFTNPWYAAVAVPWWLVLLGCGGLSVPWGFVRRMVMLGVPAVCLTTEAVGVFTRMLPAYYAAPAMSALGLRRMATLHPAALGPGTFVGAVIAATVLVSGIARRAARAGNSV